MQLVGRPISAQHTKPTLRVIEGLDALQLAIGTHLGYSDWVRVTQSQIDRFAELSGDRQWIHTDPARAAQGPFGSTIAHGYMALSLVPALSATIYTISGMRMVMNYGSNRVRFPAPLPVDSLIRVGVELRSLEAVSAGYQLVEKVTIERSGSEKPVCVAETVALLIPAVRAEKEYAHD